MSTIAEHLLKSLFIMASMVEARDLYTGGHLWRVSQYSLLLAQNVGLDPASSARVALGGFLHDLGKIGVPDAILNKRAKLTEDEYEIIKTHPRLGERILGDHLLAGLVRDAILHHHERIDGGGYPSGLRGEEIPFEARIVGICDAFDAMTSNRPYRFGMLKVRALEIIEEHRGTQFDDIYAGHFLRLGEAGLLDPMIGHTDHGIALQACPMCGPVVVVRRDHQHGDHVFCRHCGLGMVVDRSGGGLSLRPTQLRGSPADLEPEVDYALIDELVAQAAESLSDTLAAEAA